MLVFAFDRDWTVDVNPHPQHDTVPLGWVRQLAHETEHVVYAIGNQELATEAAIPGVVDIVGRHPDDWDRWLGQKQPDGHYEQFPLRRERLSLIADLHPTADAYIVVDDLDLSDIDEWEHYHAWEFVPAVKHGDIDADLPWVREPAPDGGMPTIAGIIPSDPDHLREFLRKQDRTPAFEITYRDDGAERTQMCWDVSPWSGSYGRAVPPQLSCTPLEPGAESFTIEAEAVERLSVVRPPPEQYTASAETPTETALALSRVAAVQSDAVRVSSILTLLDQDTADTTCDRAALQALQRVAVSRPADCTPAVPILQSLLTEADCPDVTATLGTLVAIGTADPEAIAPAADAIKPYLDATEDSTRREAVRCLAAIAETYPDDVVAAVPELATIIDEGAAGEESAIVALAQISDAYPGAVEPYAERLGAVLDAASNPDSVRVHATVALGNIVDSAPTVAVDIVEEVVSLFEVDDYRLRNNAVALLFDVATIHTDLLEPYVADIAGLLIVEDVYTRVNASGVLSRIAADFPASVAPLTPMFIRLLSDDEARVRENACWTLGYLEAQAAIEPLRNTAQDDEDTDVQRRAEWALARIDEWG
ncbi:MAG: HEAT repeat domain-containing protein [Halapricum sp.]